MSADLRRSFKQKAKQAFELPSRLRKGLTDHLDGSDDEHRPMSFDFGCLLQDDHHRAFAPQSVPAKKESETGTRTRQRVPFQPSGTIKYQVTGRDTLRSLAAHHGTTSSELKTINKLHSETIFEGQTLYIPDDSYSSCQPEERTELFDNSSHISTKQASPSVLLESGMETSECTTTVTVPQFENKQLEVELLSYKPLQRLICGGQDLLFTGIKPILSVTKHITTENLQKIGSSSAEDSTENSFQFIKVPAKFMKDKNTLSSVSGLLLLSSDFVMFDPDPCDIQVKEGSIEDFSTIIPIKSLGSITLMKNAESLLIDANRIILKETGEELAKQLERVVDFSDQLNLNDEGKELRIANVFEKSENSKQNLDILQRDSIKEGVIVTIKKRSCSETSDEMSRRRMEDDKDPEVLAAALDQKVFEKKRSTSMRKERPLSIVGNLFRFGGLESSSSEVSSPTFASGNKSSLGAGGSTSVENITISSPSGSKLVSRTLSSLSSYSSSLIDDFSSHLFSSTSSTPKLQAISASPSSPTPSLSSSDHQGDLPFFLKPIDVLTKKVKGQLSSSVESAGDEEDKDGDLFLQFKIVPANQAKNSSIMKSDYLFSVQHEKTATLFTFFLYWNTSSQEAQSCFDEPWFVLADRSEGFASGNVEEIEQRKKSKEWKIVNLQELKRALRISEIEKLPLPELLHESHILDHLMVKQLTFHLPPRAEGCKWELMYSTEIHGFSLKTLFRKVESSEGPSMILVKDDKSQVFGAMMSCTMKPCDTFYGNGECYLFSFYEKFRKFGWSGLNNYFIYTPFESISIGSGEGSVGLWLDGDLYYGRTQKCPTFRNDLLTENEDFIVRCLEVWRFV